MRGKKREVAHRIFMAELLKASYVIPGEKQFDPTYIVTPLGRKVNRIFWVGGLMNVQHVVDDDKDYYRAVLIDPTGQLVIVTSQQYSDAGPRLVAIGEGKIISVVAKPYVKNNRLGLRIESVAETDLETRLIWMDETKNSLLRQIDVYREMITSTDREVQLVMEHYGDEQDKEFAMVLEEI